MLTLGGGTARWDAVFPRLGLLLPTVILAAILLFPGRAEAVTFSPNTTADGDNGGVCGAVCTLRDAINAASAAPGNDVSVPAGNYTLSLGQLQINQSMTVAGAGARTTTINPQGTSRVFSVGAFQVTIRDLTITGGAAGIAAPFPAEGGGIVTDGRLHVLRSAVVGNTATFTGGGISAPFKGGTTGITIEDSLIANNTVAGGAGYVSGGGLNLFGDVTIINSTITGNSTSSSGNNQGGGLTAGRQFLSPGPNSLTLLNTTIAGNSISGAGSTGFGAGLSGDNFIGPLEFGPAMPTAAELTAKNTIIAGNTLGGSLQDCGLVNVNSTSNNLSRDATCGFTDAGSKQNANPQLQALANNGGPTNTLALGDGSAALNTGTNSGCPAVDQRGTTRPQVITCDIGAFEAKPSDLVVEQRVTGKRKKKKKKRGLATVAAKKRGKSTPFVVTVTNKGEQAAPGTKLTVKPPKKSKVKLSECDSVAKQKGKKGKGKGKGKKTELKRKRKRKRRTQPLICSLGNLGTGASRTVQIKVRPMGARKLVSKVSVSSTIADADPTTDSAQTKVRVKRPKRRR